MDISECPYAKILIEGLVMDDVFTTIKEREKACTKAYGRRKFCCDDRTVSASTPRTTTRTIPTLTTLLASSSSLETTIKMLNSSSLTTEPTTLEITSKVKTTLSTTPTTIMPEATTNAKIQDFSSHPNLAMFKTMKCGKSAEDRISGGSDAGLLEFPWAARIGYTSYKSKSVVYKCGGSLISGTHELDYESSIRLKFILNQQLIMS